MLLAIDVGNTQAVFGIFEGNVLQHHFRLSSEARRTYDEYGVLLREILHDRGIAIEAINRVVLASVVPPLTKVYQDMSTSRLGIEPIVVGPGVRTGMPILYDNPREVGADRIVNGVAGYERFCGEEGGPHGVIIVDFIDMDSRRDQLQLLEHFTGAVRDDAARPQIAQLTELGLVELTRKRQGQNIYELFGRACPSCGGLGHVAVLPGKDLLQPLATATGLVRSAASARAELPTPEDSVNGNGRRRRGGRGGRSATDQNGTESASSSPAEESVSEEPREGSPVSPVTRRPEPELVAVPMSPEQQEVFGWLGLNPALLLDPPAESDNILVRVVRPGEDAEAVLEEARQQLAANAGRRRRRGRGGRSGGRNGSETVASPAVEQGVAVDTPPAAEEVQPLMVEITPLVLDTPIETSLSVSVEPIVEAAPAEAAPVEEESEEPRRRRRRSSASASS